mmetsp:Transcript_27798/g.56209  ORF Transcript_27798/g.56209 Transcript_27798/m.56209 type:complete len:103 (+) Transcript_27798:61-369(+)
MYPTSSIVTERLSFVPSSLSSVDPRSTASIPRTNDSAVSMMYATRRILSLQIASEWSTPARCFASSKSSCMKRHSSVSSEDVEEDDDEEEDDEDDVDEDDDD